MPNAASGGIPPGAESQRFATDSTPSSLAAEEDDEAVLLRKRLTSEQRTAQARLAIDPGFVNYRLIEHVLGARAMSAIDAQISDLPADLPDWLRLTRVGHVYTRTLVWFCEINGVPSLGAMLSERRGSLFCSTERLAPTPGVYDADRVCTQVIKPEIRDLRAELHYTTKWIRSDTVRSRLHDGAELSVVGLRRSIGDGVVVCEPLVIGSPWLVNIDDEVRFEHAEWWGHSYGEVFVEDIEEFAEVRNVEAEQDFSIMQRVSESAFKQCLAEILRETAPKDWAGEQSDLYSSHINLGGRRTTAAFLLKGPGSGFSPMTFRHLGTNGDQLYRLSQEPAGLLVVQHCHDITSAIRETLRRFAIVPGELRRRYCLIDGRDSLRILVAYDMLARALRLSKA